MKNANALEIYMLDLVNAARKKHGVSELTLERNLNESSENYSKDMLSKGYFSHDGADGSTSHERIVRDGYDLSSGWSTGENIAAGVLGGSSGYFDDVKRLFEGLMDSPGHKANILAAKYEHAGFGIEMGSYGPLGGRKSMVITQHFGRSSGEMDDQLVGSGGRDRQNGGDGRDLLDGNGGNDVLRGGSDSDVVLGDAGRDRLFGDTGNDKLKGGGDNDKLFGGSGRDNLRGDGGRDRLCGDDGNDKMTGGGGNDTFVFRNGDDRDTITDLRAGRDAVLLDDALWNADLSAREVVDRFGQRQGGSITLDFGDDSLTFDGFSNFSALADCIDIF